LDSKLLIAVHDEQRHRDDDDWVPLAEAAERLGLPVKTVEELARMGVLLARHDGWGWEVQPALIRGYTTNQ
jgi:hypothetical protein